MTLAKSREAFLEVRKLPAPRRGEILRQIRDELSKKVSILKMYSLSTTESDLRFVSYRETNLAPWFLLRWERSEQKAREKFKSLLI